jgi:hypothetical protein
VVCAVGHVPVPCTDYWDIPITVKNIPNKQKKILIVVVRPINADENDVTIT